jgi:hypothetical protein
VDLVRQKTYKKVFDMACSDLRSLNIERQAGNCGVRLRETAGQTNLEIPWFDEIIRLRLPEFSFTSSKGSSVNLVTRIIVLHYLSRGSGAPIEPELVSYEDIDPSMRHYLPVFERRAIKPLISAFGYNRDAFLQSGLALGGQEETYGNGSFTLNVLPRVPITFILWEGDEEFPPSVKILFNPSVSKYLPLEDIVVISKLAATRIVKTARLKYTEEVNE